MKRFTPSAIFASVFAVALPLGSVTAQATPRPFGERVAQSRSRAPERVLPATRASVPTRSGVARRASVPTPRVQAPSIGAHPQERGHGVDRDGRGRPFDVRGTAQGHGGGLHGGVSVTIGNGRVRIGGHLESCACHECSPPVARTACGFWETVRERVCVPAVYEWRRDACGRSYRVCVSPEHFEWRCRRVFRAGCHDGCVHHQRGRGRDRGRRFDAPIHVHASR
ncbi:MAG: hypothetical protein KDC95_10840 [Planctomycetes bacterium]|nr:hypothetical protein [Planctomycetota bacterium]